MTPTYEEALEFCIRHYVERGNTYEHAHSFIAWYPEEKIFELYDIIQKQTEAMNNGEYYLLP